MVNDFTALVAEHKETNSIVALTHDFSAQSGALVPHLPALVQQSRAIMPHITGFTPQNGTTVPRTPSLVPHNSVFVQHMPALAPQSGAVLPHIPTIAAQHSVLLHIPALSAQSSVIVQQIPAFSPQSGAIVAHIPVVSPQNGAIVPSQNGTNVFQSPPGATDMIMNAQNIPQPAPVLVPPRRLHPDERTLFVTFSNGSPLTEDELLEFFAEYVCTLLFMMRILRKFHSA
jgi:hypothetical protein